MGTQAQNSVSRTKALRKGPNGAPSTKKAAVFGPTQSSALRWVANTGPIHVCSGGEMNLYPLSPWKLFYGLVQDRVCEPTLRADEIQSQIHKVVTRIHYGYGHRI
jgi:hypothetical protein